MAENFVTIIKNEEFINIDEDDLQKNDVIVLQAGELVPADILLIEARELEVDEFEIIGEILPIKKEISNEDVFLFMGSKIIKGEGKGIVTAVREETEYGAILNQGKNQSPQYHFRFFNHYFWIPITIVLPALVTRLFLSTLAFDFFLISTACFFLSVFLQNTELFKRLFFSKASRDCDRAGIEIKDTSIFETIHDVNIVCLDKTGVLTTRELTVKSIRLTNKMVKINKKVKLGNQRIDQLIKLGCALCNDVIYFEKVNKANPIDKALIRFSQEQGYFIKDLLAQSTRIYDKPFQSENRYMAAGYKIQDEIVYFIKGDPEIVTSLCNSYYSFNGQKKAFDSEFWSSFNSNNSKASLNGDVSIALAYTSEFNESKPNSFSYLCTIHLENPLKRGSREIIAQLSQKGIRSILLTGDRTEAALQVGFDSGISKDKEICITGKMLNKMNFSEIARQAAYCSVFSRLLPSQKGIIIRLLQQRGNKVMMIGDGPNDGIALKSADIGISFFKESSAIARKFAKILVNDLYDLIFLLRISDEIEKKIHLLKIFRVVIFTFIFFCLLWFP